MTLSPSDNPFVRAPWTRRARTAAAALGSFVRRATVGSVRRAYFSFRRLPRRTRIVLVALLLISGTGAGYRFSTWYQNRITGREVYAAWRGFDETAQKGGSADALRVYLDRILKLEPGNRLAAGRLAGLESGTADPQDQPMVLLAMRRHAAAGRLAESAREAEKRIAVAPADWHARCLLAEYALAHGDRAAADAHLHVLATVEGYGPDPGGLLYAVNLFQRSGRDTTRLRMYLPSILHLLRGEAVATLPPGTLVHMVGCYAFALTDPNLAGGTATYWVPAARLSEVALVKAIEDGETRTLTVLGELGLPLAAGLARLRASGQITTKDETPLAAELEDRTRRAWRAVLEKEPANPAAYYGLALSHARGRDDAQCHAVLVRGLKACGDSPKLIELLAAGSQGAGRSVDALDLVWEAAERHPRDATYWLMAVNAAVAAQRRDKALEACEKARELAPGRQDVARAEAVLWCEAGRPRKALAALEPFPVADLARDPAAVRPLAQGLAATGEATRLTELLTVARTAAGPDTLTAAAQGIFAAPPDLARAERAAGLASEVLARWPGTVAATRLRAVALVRSLELGPPAWDEKRIKAAAVACEVALAAVPNDVAVAAGLAWVRLRGLKQPAAALRAVAPLRAVEVLPGDAAAVLGEVLLENGHTKEAVRVLERAQGRIDSTPGGLLQLARAYHAVGRPDDARYVLQVVHSMPQSDRERADYQTVYNKLYRQ